MTTGMAALDDPARLAHLVGGRYELLEKLGEGAVGVVYRARHTGLDRQFAVKLLRPELALDPESLDRFQREATVLGRLRHPNVVDVTDFGLDDGPAGRRAFLVMELLQGETLADLVEREGALPPARALPLLAAIAAAVDAVHASGIVHRDLKPNNVILARGPGGTPVVKVLDFGLSGFLDRLRPENRPENLDDGGFSGNAEETNFLVGTPLYTAPEYLGGGHKAGAAADLYTLGVIAYELLLGRPPFLGTTRDILLGHLGGEPPPPETLGVELPRGLWTALVRALAKDPGQRPATARELVGALEGAVRELERARFEKAFNARRLGLLAGGLAVLAAVALTFPDGIPPLERRLYDRRLAAAPAHLPDPRLVLVVLDEAELASRRTAGGGQVPLADPAWADEFAARLGAALDAGARGVALDFLLGSGWNASERFADFLLAHEGKVVLAVESVDGRIQGTEVARGLTAAALGERAAGLFGFVDVEVEADGVIRHGRSAFLTPEGTPFPSWAARAAALLRPGETAAPLPRVFPLDGRIDRNRYSRLTWRELEEQLRHDPGSLRDRLLLVGADVPEDRHRVPGPSGEPVEIPGLTLQALAVDTIGRGLPVREAPAAPFLLGALALTVAGMALVLAPREAAARRAAALLAGLALSYVVLSFVLFRQTGRMVPTSGPPALAALGTALALAARPLLPRLETEPPR